MAKINIIYWSGTGNTEKMAELILEGIKSKGIDAEMKSVSEATIEDVLSSEALALGCPSMGSEELEEGEMQPFIESIEDKISGKKLALFGSYGWGDGLWMREWEDRMKDNGADLIQDGLIINGFPESDEDESSCIELGKKLVNS
ncbi:flavodoxin [Anaerosalibacter massiliensis]|uniref:Flavodoxin n=1 Tax=Anaerosalibacter massiliensis TaxID=1347392 RepID=A0A9X2MKD2_9FIRM|nr:flavodoxin [Anaerosalibacter massiliensis]MCR2045086.1 flavodoxin [Anaerosalibacter massiliensis]